MGLSGAGTRQRKPADSDVLSGARVRFLHGRPGPHPQHRRFVEAVGGEFEYIDFRMRWHDRNRSRIYRIVSEMSCALTLHDRRKHDVFLVEGLHFWPVLMKRTLLRRNQKIVLHLANETGYFLLSHRYSPSVERLHLRAMRNYDAIICQSQMTAEIVHQLLGDECPPTYPVFGGTPTERVDPLLKVEPDLSSRRITFVGSGPVEFRMHYKGLDLMIAAVSLAAASDPEIEFEILGEWNPEIVESLTAGLEPPIRRRIHFRGQVDEITDWFRRSSLYLHCARGEAFGLSILEAMTAGVVPLVSEWTGAREVVGQVSERLIAPLDAREIAERISWYFSLPPDAREGLSRRSRTAAMEYTERAAVGHYKRTFAALCEDLGVGGHSAPT